MLSSWEVGDPAFRKAGPGSIPSSAQQGIIITQMQEKTSAQEKNTMQMKNGDAWCIVL